MKGCITLIITNKNLFIHVRTLYKNGPIQFLKIIYKSFFFSLSENKQDMFSTDFVFIVHCFRLHFQIYYYSYTYKNDLSSDSRII